MEHEQTFWISRYRSLYEIISESENVLGQWSVHDGYPLPAGVDYSNLPVDIVAFLKVFGVGSEIGVRGYNVLHVEFPEVYSSSDVCEMFVLDTKDFDQLTPEKLFGDKNVPLKFVLFWGYNVEAEAFAYDTRSAPYAVCASNLIHDEEYQTFDEVLSYHLKLHCDGDIKILHWLSDT